MGRTYKIKLNKESKEFYHNMFLARKLQTWVEQYKTLHALNYDDDVDWSEYSLEYLRERVKLVQRFDELCDDIRNELVYYLDSHKLVEEEYTVTKTRKVFEEIA